MDRLNPSTVANCFHKEGFVVQLCRCGDGFPESTVLENDDDILLAVLFSRGMTFDDYANVDDDVNISQLAP